jgi:hypothetical protein
MMMYKIEFRCLVISRARALPWLGHYPSGSSASGAARPSPYILPSRTSAIFAP